FIDLGKRFSPIYLKNRDDLKKGYQNILIFKKILDEKIDSLLKKDNEIIKKRIEKMKGEEEIRNYFYEGDILKEDKYLFFDFMLISSVNLNKENVTLIDEKAKKDFLFRIVNQEIQEIKLKEIIINSGLKVFLNESFSSQIQKKLLKKESFIKENLRIDNFLEEINESDLKNLFEKILKEKYEEKYLKEFFKEHKLISNL
ncbi:MAG: hypothetical protein L6266_03170, partial [Nanoarchaeota archaeon]|nr:hypothetical protein [Nanoarchaeota archaeon]